MTMKRTPPPFPLTECAEKQRLVWRKQRISAECHEDDPAAARLSSSPLASPQRQLSSSSSLCSLLVPSRSGKKRPRQQQQQQQGRNVLESPCSFVRPWLPPSSSVSSEANHSINNTGLEEPRYDTGPLTHQFLYYDKHFSRRQTQTTSKTRTTNGSRAIGCWIMTMLAFFRFEPTLAYSGNYYKYNTNYNSYNTNYNNKNNNNNNNKDNHNGENNQDNNNNNDDPDGNNNNNDPNNNNNNNNDLNNNNMGMDQADFESATTSTFFTSTINPKAFLNVQPVCGNTGSTVNPLAGVELEVTSIYLTCDSPGAYYPGSSTHRNSNVCTAGDKAQVNLALTIRETSDTINYANELLYVTMQSGFFNRFVTLYHDYHLCEMDITSATTGSSTTCPTPGKYYMQIYFQVPSYTEGTTGSGYTSPRSDDDNDDATLSVEDASMHYTPDIRFVFANAQKSIVGCASTGAAAWNNDHSTKTWYGMTALGMAVSGLLLTFALMLWMNHLRRKRLEEQQGKQQAAAAAAAPQRMYQYFKTLPNGQVVPIPHGMLPVLGRQRRPPLRMPPPPPPYPPQFVHPPHVILPAHSVDSTTGMDSNGAVAATTAHGRHANNHIPMISNPSYNETLLPTRPVI